jgi:hypothetical protein
MSTSNLGRSGQGRWRTRVSAIPGIDRRTCRSVRVLRRPNTAFGRDIRWTLSVTPWLGELTYGSGMVKHNDHSDYKT